MSGYRFPFEKLEVWQDSRKLVKTIYELTERFPHGEKYGLVSQTNRAAVSVASNLAEGSSRTSFRDQGHFSQLAYSSLMELACQLTLAVDIGFLTEEQFEPLRQSINRMANQINALRISQINRVSS